MLPITGFWLSETRTSDMAYIKIGDALGITLGFASFSLFNNDLVLLGYPCNLDNAISMRQVFSGQSANFPNNNVLYGDDMEQGSSGGPWIQDFGVAAAGQVGGATNLVVGVASFTLDPPVPPAGCTTNPVRRVLGASIFTDDFFRVVNAACNQAPGNC
jgi:hypothetical protein